MPRDGRGLRLPGDPAALADLTDFVEQEFSSQVSGCVAVVIDEDLDSGLSADAYQVTCTVARAELFEDYDQALRWIMRREFVPSVRLLQQQNSTRDGRNHTPE